MRSRAAISDYTRRAPPAGECLAARENRTQRRRPEAQLIGNSDELGNSDNTFRSARSLRFITEFLSAANAIDIAFSLRRSVNT
jgi:hypothetical protein